MKNIFHRNKKYRYFIVPYIARVGNTVLRNTLLVKYDGFPPLSYLKTGVHGFKEGDLFNVISLNEVSQKDFYNYTKEKE